MGSNNNKLKHSITKRKGSSRKAVLFVVLIAFLCYSVFLRTPPTEDLFVLEKGVPQQETTVQSSSTFGYTKHRVAGLSCDAHGGPSAPELAAEMVYWRDIPADAHYESPLKHNTETRYLTFEPDEGGFNNMRMGMETAVALAIAMGRTLVLPPKMHMYLLWQGQGPQHNVMGYKDFYHFDSVAAEHNFEIITFEEFLQREAITGKLLDVHTGMPTFPPENRTDYTGAFRNFDQTKTGTAKPLWEWMRNHAAVPLSWAYDKCVVGIPAAPGKEAADGMRRYLLEVLKRDGGQGWAKRRDSYTGNPVAVNASATDRLAELLANRQSICVYDEQLQNTKVLHSIGETNTGYRLLIHFYAFLFMEDWRTDLWLKRFVRDHLRYLDEIQCAAARVVAAVRTIARSTNGDPSGRYDSFHIRRGDFQYKDVRLMDAEEIYANNSASVIPDGRAVFIATDEKNMTFFEPLREHYKLLFLNDFKDEIAGINPNYYGMLDQLVASRGEVFFGAFYSTFTGYINRIRGYHSQKDKLDGYEQGAINSYYYVPPRLAQFRETMRTYGAVQQAFWQQEFPIGWRDIDHDVETLQR